LWVAITGGLHLDGLADCADAWVGGFGNRQRSLAIMKDPAAGPIAVLVLVLLLLLKWSLISSIIEKQALSVLLLTPLLGRLAILMLMSTSDYIRTGGLAEKLIANLPQGAVNITIFLWLLITVFFLGILALVAVFLMIFIIRRLANKRLGGVTGDVYGATVELVEVSILMSVLI
ncbi:MAG: adenosylcobinamide-GDP ribazoletransferase, partial [Methylococcales bacterium]